MRRVVGVLAVVEAAVRVGVGRTGNCDDSGATGSSVTDARSEQRSARRLDDRDGGDAGMPLGTGPTLVGQPRPVGRGLLLMWVLALAGATLMSGVATASSTRETLRVDVQAYAGTGRQVVITGQVSGRPRIAAASRRRWSIVLQRKEGRKWRRLMRRTAPAPGVTFEIRHKVSGRATGVVLRVVVRSSTRQLAASRPLLMRIPTKPDFVVPKTTRMYAGTQIERVKQSPEDDKVVVTVTPPSGSAGPIVGGHVALGPAPGLPHGMFARIEAVATSADGSKTMQLRTASIDEVFADVRYSFAGDVTPRVVDENGDAVSRSSSGARAAVISGTGSFRAAATAAGAAFRCKETGGLPRAADDVWTRTGLPFPIEVKLENTKIVHDFNAGSVLPPRKPSLLLQLTGDAVVSVGFEAKTGFECELSTKYRRNNRIELPIKNIGPVPVNIYLEPVLRFGVSAAGKVALKQRHYFALTLRKNGSDPLRFERVSSAGPVNPEIGARVQASLFAGGDLSLLIGAAGKKDTSVGAGLYGAFGPEFAITTATSAPGCVDANWKLRADLGVRLQLYSQKRWNLELASLTSPDFGFPGFPRCGLPAPPESVPPMPPPPPPPPPEPPPPPATGASVTAGDTHTCLLRPTGQVACWGHNGAGQLGDGTTTPRLTPVRVLNLNDATAISVNDSHSCALRSTGQVACWGGNNGRLGDGTTESRPTPELVRDISDAIAISVGGGVSCALRQTGQVVCWGPRRGLSGDGDTESLSPVTVKDLDDATAISAGLDHSCAVRRTGRVACWGNNKYGQLGDGTLTSHLTPDTVQSISDATTISVNGSHTCAVRQTGQVACWGHNNYGQLGDGTTVNRTTPVPASGLTDAVRISVGGYHSCALRQSGQATCWGRNTFGQLGDGTSTDRLVAPDAIPGVGEATGISAGTYHSCALRQAGPIVCWGSNSFAQLGDGTTIHRYSPVVVVDTS